jgi:peptidoglycan hydrolase-like protein with peptidoglycan-binding domain
MIGNKLCFGAEGDKVRKLQEHLKDFGFYHNDIDGLFGERTIEAVYLFQDACDLKIDGIVGPKTMNEINKLLMLPEEKRFIIIAFEK